MDSRLFDFQNNDPGRLLGECQPEDLFRAVKALGQWNQRALGVTHSALAHWASEALARSRNRRERIGEIQGLIRRLQVIQPLEKQASELKVAERYLRWNGMVDVLEAHAYMLDYNPAME